MPRYKLKNLFSFKGKTSSSNNTDQEALINPLEKKLKKKLQKRQEKTKKRTNAYSNELKKAKQGAANGCELVRAKKRVARSFMKERKLELKCDNLSGDNDEELLKRTNDYNLYKKLQPIAYMYSEGGGRITDVDAFVKKVKMQRDAPLVNNQQPKQHP